MIRTVRRSVIISTYQLAIYLSKFELICSIKRSLGFFRSTKYIFVVGYGDQNTGDFDMKQRKQDKSKMRNKLKNIN